MCQKSKNTIYLYFLPCSKQKDTYIKKILILVTLHVMHIRAIAIPIYTKYRLDCDEAVTWKHLYAGSFFTLESFVLERSLLLLL